MPHRTSPAMLNVPSESWNPVHLHVCPVCNKTHAVTPAYQSVAWGRQLCCSCVCEVERRRRVRKQHHDAFALRVQHKR